MHAYHMTVIIGVSTIITQESHGVSFNDVLRVCLHELLGAVPKSWDSLDVFVQTQDETVLLFVIGHEFESIVVDIAEQLNAWLNTPVPLKLLHQRVLEEESRFESTHMAVADGVSIDDLALSHIFTDLAGFILVDVVWERPVLLGNLAIMGCAGNQ